MDNFEGLEKKFIEIKEQGINELKILYFELGLFCQENLNNIAFYLRKSDFRIRGNQGYYYFEGNEDELKKQYPNVDTSQVVEAYKQFKRICQSPFFEHLNIQYDHLGLIFNREGNKEALLCHSDLTQEFLQYKQNKAKKEAKELLDKELPNNNSIEKKLKI